MTIPDEVCDRAAHAAGGRTVAAARGGVAAPPGGLVSGRGADEAVAQLAQAGQFDLDHVAMDEIR